MFTNEHFWSLYSAISYAIVRPPSITATLGLTQSCEIDFNSKKLSYYFAKLNFENNKKPNSNLQKVCELYLEIDRLLLLFGWQLLSHRGQATMHVAEVNRTIEQLSVKSTVLTNWWFKLLATVLSTF